MARYQFRSVRSLMIAVVVCALLLTPLAYLARQNALRKFRREQAGAHRLRALALGQQARAAFLARARAGDTISRGTTRGTGAERGLGSGRAVKQGEALSEPTPVPARVHTTP
jgi:hypothetical protein